MKFVVFSICYSKIENIKVLFNITYQTHSIIIKITTMERNEDEISDDEYTYVKKKCKHCNKTIHIIAGERAVCNQCIPIVEHARKLELLREEEDEAKRIAVDEAKRKQREMQSRIIDTKYT